MAFDLETSVLAQLLPEVLKLALDTGEAILAAEKENITVEYKADATPVTNADLIANQVVVDGLSKMSGNFPIISEESVIPPFQQRKLWSSYWLVDPLDGTKEFIKQNGQYSVNIALIENHQSILGVIYAPVTKTLYYAIRGDGAYRVINNGKAEKLVVCNQRRSPLIVACGNSPPSPGFTQMMKHLGEVDYHHMGSSLKSCLIAEGSADLYARLGPTSEWDTAAAQCIVEEAGGFLVDLNLNPLRYNTKDSLLNSEFLVYGDTDQNWLQYC